MAAIATPSVSVHPLGILSEVARRQDGLFLLADALAAGVSQRVVRRLVAERTIERAHPGVYRFTAVPWTWEAKQRAAVLAAGPGACASHTGAARWLGMADVPIGRPEVTVAGKHLRIDGVRTHRTRALEDCDITEVRGLACTTGSRTLVDLGSRFERNELIAIADAAICAQIASRSNVFERATRLGPGRRGTGPLIEITAEGADGVFWSSLERRFGELVGASGLPQPEFNARLEHGGRVLYADALWAAHGVIAELQGLRFHSMPAQRGRDDERRNAFAALELRVLVFSWQQVVEEPGAVLATLAGVLSTPS